MSASGGPGPIASLLATVRDLLYPPACLACGRPVRGAALFCRGCHRALPVIRGPRCELCSMPFPGGTDAFSCRNCKGAEFAFGFSVSRYRAEGAIRELIHRFKYGRAMHLARPLGQLLARSLHDPRIDPSQIEAMVPVPLHPVRQRERGFNQAELIAREAGGLRGFRVLRLLRRVRHTTTQTRFSRAARMRNLRGAFDLVQNASVKGKRFLLVDDVFTTGSTLHQCARVLVRAGAREVDAVTLARG